MALSYQALDILLKRLHLASTRRALRELTAPAETEEWSYRDFLALLVSEEIAQRQQTRLARLVRRAHSPFLKTIDDLKFLHQSIVRLTLLGAALAPEFATDGRLDDDVLKAVDRLRLAVFEQFEVGLRQVQIRCSVAGREDIDPYEITQRLGGELEASRTTAAAGIRPLNAVMCAGQIVPILSRS